MADIIQQIEISCKPEELYNAILVKGADWWTSDTEIGKDETRFYFEDRSVVFRMKPERLEPPKRIDWKCIGDHPEWTGTRLIFEISLDDDGGCALRLTHADWKSATAYFAGCGYAWAHILDHLKEFAETKKSVPFFKA
jgi:hypothetical protein